MFTVYHSNQVDILKSLVCELMQRDPLDFVFQKEMVIVQSQGMAQWLQIQLAEELGIAANIAFPFPTQFIDQLYHQLQSKMGFSQVSLEKTLNSESLTWQLFSLLPNVIERPEFAPLNYYLNVDGQERKRYQLATRIANLFDQYLVYRPDWIAQWEAGKKVTELNHHPDEIWQSELWRQLMINEQFSHRASIYQQMKSQLLSPHFDVSLLQGLPKRIFIFGITSLPPVYLLLLNALGKHIDVHLMFSNPCKEYWGDIIDKQNRLTPCQSLPNPLLASLGKLGRDHLFLLQEFSDKRDIDGFADYGQASLLQAIQQDILTLYQESECKRAIEPNDRTITFHACHSEQREVEVLYDHLLSLLDSDPTLDLRDCVVMVSDIDRYVPYIQAVFGNAAQGRYLPFTISDQKARNIDPIVQGFFSILNFPQSRLTAEDLFNLLEIPAIAEHFSIDQSQLVQLKVWIVESGIRFGLDTPHGWLFGLERLLLGYAMDSEYGSWQNILPYNGATGLDAELIGQFAEFIAIVQKWLIWLKEPKNLRDWQSCCVELLNDFFATNAKNQSILLLITQEWQKLIESGLSADFTDEVSVTILYEAMQSRLEQTQLSHRFLVGNINFCTMMPMRSIPFKVVCLLGMNDGVYPRSSSPLNFDLISMFARRGDRSRRNDDRYLFLEALLSAEQQLYISYIGREMKDDSERYPSVLVDELWDYINQYYCVKGQAASVFEESPFHFLKVKHTRTPFNPKNYHHEPKSYADEWLPAAAKQGENQPFIGEISSIDIEKINLDELKRFYQHSVKLFLQKRFHYYVSYLDEVLPEAENFSLDGLERYQLNQQILEQIISPDVTQEKLSAFYQRLMLSGDFPDGAFGEIIYEAQTQAMQPLAEKVMRETQAPFSQEVNLTLENYQLQGWLTHVQQDGILKWRPSKLSIRDGVALWIDHLVYCIINPDKSTSQSRIYGREDSEWRFLSLNVNHASALLANLIEGYVKGMNHPLLLPLQSAWNWLTHAYHRETDSVESNQKADDQLIHTWQGGFNQSAECDDYYFRLYPELTDEIIEQVKIDAQRFLLPILRYLAVEKK